MNKLILLTICIASVMPLSAQERNTDEGGFTLQIVNKRGRPVKNPKVIAYISGQEENATLPDDRGVASWENVSVEDTLHLVMAGHLYSVPIDDMEKMVFVVNNKKLQRQNRATGETHSLGYVDVSNDVNTLPVTTVRRNDLLHYRDLADYIDGRVAGVQVERYGSSVSVIIRGKGSIMGDNKAIAVVDGMVTEFDTANLTISPNDVESVTVLKDGSMYGVRGMNGVIVIKTRSK